MTSLTPATISSRSSSSKKSRLTTARMTEARHQGETEFHQTVAQFLDAVLPRDTWWTTFPAGGGGRVRGAILKGMGLKAGVPDVLIVQRGFAYWIELKTPKGIVSGDQTNTHADLLAVGCAVTVCRTLDDVVAALRCWGFELKGRLSA